VPKPSATWTASGTLNAVPTAVDWGDPPVMVTTTGCGDASVSVKVAVNPPAVAATGNVPGLALIGALAVAVAVPVASVSAAPVTIAEAPLELPLKK